MVFLDSTDYHLIAYLIYALRIPSPQNHSASQLHYCSIVSLGDIYGSQEDDNYIARDF